MKSLFCVLGAFALGLLTACSTTPSTSTGSGANAPVAEGSSFEKAIVIHASSEGAGVKMEYAWIRTNLPGFRPAGQSLQNHEGRPYDVIHLVSSGGDRREVYFDISEFFGRF